MPSFTWGAHKGKDYADTSIPDDYYTWLIAMRQKDLNEYQAELDRRASAQEASLDVTEQILVTGYRALAMKFHPDKGGDPAKFRELQGSYELLRGIMAEAKGAGGGGGK